MEDYKTLLERNGFLFLDKPAVDPNEWVKANRIGFGVSDILESSLVIYTFKFENDEYSIKIKAKDKNSVFRKALRDGKIGNVNDLEICLNTIREKNNNADRKLRLCGIEGTFGEFKEYFGVDSIVIEEHALKGLRKKSSYTDIFGKKPI